MDYKEYKNIDAELANRANAEFSYLSVCRNDDSPQKGNNPQVGDYAILYAKSDKEIPIGATDGRIKVKIEGIADGRYLGVICDSHYDNPMPLGTKVSFHSTRIFRVSDI